MSLIIYKKLLRGMIIILCCISLLPHLELFWFRHEERNSDSFHFPSGFYTAHSSLQ